MKVAAKPQGDSEIPTHERHPLAGPRGIEPKTMVRASQLAVPHAPEAQPCCLVHTAVALNHGGSRPVPPGHELFPEPFETHELVAECAGLENGIPLVGNHSPSIGPEHDKVWWRGHGVPTSALRSAYP